MQTPSLTEARRALLELQNGGYSTETKWYEDTLAIIAAYLDAQVPLNVENIAPLQNKTFQFRPPQERPLSGLPNIPGVNDVVSSANFVFCTSDRNALKPETGNRRYVEFNPMQPPLGPMPRARVVPGSIRHDKDSRTLRCDVEFSNEALTVMTPEQIATIRGSLASRCRVTPTPSCGKCFKCLNGGVGKGMEHADPLKPCDGVK